MNRTSKFSHILSHLKKSFLHYPGTQIATMVVLVASFTVVLGATLVAQNLKQIMTLWGQSMEVSVYLKDSAGPKEVGDLENLLSENKNVSNLKFVGREKALDIFREQMASYAPDLLKDPEIAKVIPESFQFAISSAVPVEDHLGVIEKLSSTLQKITGVDSVAYGQDWIRNYAGVVKAVSGTGLIFSIILLTSVLFVVANAVRTSISQRRFEIEVLELIGATPKYIREPFLWEGGLIAAIAFLVSVVLGRALFDLASERLGTEMATLQLTKHIHFLSGNTISFLFIASVALGVLASYICVRSINDGWSHSQRINKG